MDESRGADRVHDTAPRVVSSVDPRPLTNADAAAQGISRGQLAGNFVRIVHGSHLHKTIERSLAVNCAAASLVLPQSAVFSDLTAAELLGLPMPFGLPADRPLGVTVLPPTDRPVGNGIRGRRRVLLPSQIVTVGGLRVTAAARTFLDLAATLDEANVVMVGDAILRLRLDSIAGLAAILRESSGRRGVVRARNALERLDGRSRSPSESLLRVRIEDAGLPRPSVNVPAFDSCGGWIAEPDLLYEDAKIAIEYEGAHHRGERQFGRDIARDTLLTEAGFVVVRAWRRDLCPNATRLPDTLRMLLSERAPWTLT